MKAVKPIGSLAAFINSTDDGHTLTLTVHTALLDDIGTYILEVIETDVLTESQKVTQVNLVVLSPLFLDNSKSLTSLYALDKLIAAKIKEILLSFNITKTETQSAEYQVPLIAEIYDFTPTGNLTIEFNKPIILPPLMVLNETKIESNRRRLDEAATVDNQTNKADEDLLEQLKCLKTPMPVRCVLNITLETAFDVEEASEQVRVSNYYLTRLESDSMDVHVDFNYPEVVSIIKKEPDNLKIDFTYGEVFTDEQDYLNLSR